MNSLLRDLSHGIRVLRQTPVFSLVAIVTLALGVGANAAIFSLARALLVRPVEGVRAEGVFHVTARRGDGSTDAIFSYQDYTRLRVSTTSAELAAHYSSAPLTEDADAAREVAGAAVSSNFFHILGVEPQRGRFFTSAEESTRGGAPVAVISDAFWRERFGGRSDVVGAEVRLNGVLFTVIGVAPPDFHGVRATWQNDVWLPLSMLGTAYRWCDPFQPGCDTLGLVGRLHDGVTLERARAELGGLSASLTPEGDDDALRTLQLTPLGGLMPGAGRQGWRENIVLLFIAGGLILGVACANLAGALLSSGLTRRGELAVRMSLGASAGRIWRQSLTESLMLAMAGAAPGILVAGRIQRVVTAMYAVDSEGYPMPLHLRLDPAVVAFAVVLALATGVLFGLAPAWGAGRHDLSRTLHESGIRSARRPRLAGVLAVAQVSLTLAALVGGGLLARSAARIGAGAGFDPSHVALFRVRPRLIGYSASRSRPYTAEVLRRLAATPGVRAATLADGVGFVWGDGESAPTWASDAPPEDPTSAQRAGRNQVAPHFFETLGAEVVGREFSAADRAGAEPVAIVDRTLARQLWPEGAVLGRSVVVDGQARRVVGIVEDMHFHSATEPARPHLWTPYAQDTTQVDARFAVRVQGDPAARVSELLRVVRGVDPEVPVTEILTLRTQVRAAFRSVRVIALAVVYSAVLAVVLAGIGLYGMVAFTVTSQRRAIAVRKALGAGAPAVVGALARDLGAILLAGAGAGLVLALALARILAHLAYGVAPWDPLTLALAVTTLLAVALAAFAWPTRSALRVAPREALAE